ncbi:MAG: hypothetical protein HGA96_05090 [Desulfobulbaceae bacterium]|nr:hypothetical protein [Desulfobulbaceae bacterium]
MNASKTLNPLGKVKQIVEAVGMGVSYAHEDLVFLEHNGFLLEFTDSDREVLVHLNIEANEEELVDALMQLQNKAVSYGLQFSEGCSYRLSEVDEENIRIEFLNH